MKKRHGQTPTILILILMLITTLTLYKKDDSITIAKDDTTEQVSIIKQNPPLEISSLDKQYLTSSDVERCQIEDAIEVVKLRINEQEVYNQYMIEHKPIVRSTIKYTLTAYCPCAHCCGTANKPTASGVMPTANHTLSADTSIFPLGTKLRINGIVYTVEDTGSAIHGYKFDIYFNTHQEALNFGRQTTTDVQIVE